MDRLKGGLSQPGHRVGMGQTHLPRTCNVITNRISICCETTSDTPEDSASSCKIKSSGGTKRIKSPACVGRPASCMEAARSY